MEKPTIGIKIADGSYFPILEEGTTKRKRLVLTTVNDDQESVQIDLYKGKGVELLDAAYVGSLLIENIAQGPKESSEIELKIGVDKDGTLNAEAGDLASDQIESLSLSMESLGESAMYDIPEFSLDEDLMIPESSDIDLDSEELSLDDEDLDFDDMSEEDFDLDIDDLSFDDEKTETPKLDEGDEAIIEDPLSSEFAESVEEEDDFVPGFLPESEVIQPRNKKSSNPFLIALLVIIAIAAIAGISYLIFRSLQGEDAPVLEAKANTQSTPSAPSASSGTEEAVSELKATVPVVDTTNEEQQSDEATTVQPPVIQESVRVLDTTGVWYKIRWGDTLWGISYSFYDSPRDYYQIVKENSINNPDIIFAETEIFIPSK